MQDVQKNMLKGDEIVSKLMALFFALVSTALLAVCAIMISENGWLALLFGMLTVVVIGIGFVVKARRRRQSGGGPGANDAEPGANGSGS